MYLLVPGNGLPKPLLSKLLMIMKLLAVFICIASLHVHAETYSQRVTLTGKNLSLKQFVEKLKAQTGLAFVFDNAISEHAQSISVNAKDAPLTEVLQSCLSVHGLTYSINNNVVLITKAVAIPEAAKFAAAPPVTIKGKVTGKQGPLEGATIVVKGTSRKTVTNAKGEFELSNVNTDATLVISMAGYKNHEIKVSAANTNLSIELVEDAGTLSDVVVTGFQNIEKKKFTGSAVTLKADEIKVDGMMDVSRMLEGRAAGVSIQNVSGTFGAAPKIRIRGATSLNGDNKPLWVIDGVVLEDVVNVSNQQLSSGDASTLLGSAVAGLNPNDIESFDILKDAAAAALYGARAMNGVIVITTKKGKVTPKPVVNYNGNFSTQLKPSYRDFNISNSAQQMDVLVDLENKGFLNTQVASGENYGVYGKMYSLMFADNNNNFPVINTPEEKAKFLLRYANANTNWFDLLFRNNFIQEHSISISTGTEKAQNFFSGSFLSDNGWTLADKVKRYTFNYKNTYRFSDKISAGFSAAAAVRMQRAPGTIDRQSNPVEGKYDRDFDINPFSFALNTSRAMTVYNPDGSREYFRRNFAPFNILTEMENNYINLKMNDVRFQGDFSYKFSRHLSYDFIGAMRFVKSTRENIVTENSNMANAYRAADNATMAADNRFLYTDPSEPDKAPQIVLPYGGFYNRSEDQLSFYNIRNTIRYNNTFADKHALTVLAGQEVKYTDRQASNNTGYGYRYDQGGTVFLDYRILKKTIEQNFPYYANRTDFNRFLGYYGSLGYTYDKKYNINFTVREDGSNRFGETAVARWLPTWTTSASWNIDQEAFVMNKKWLSYAKLRASYGLSGDMGPATNASVLLRNVTTDRPYTNEREAAAVLAGLENKDLTWEKQYAANLGLDLGILNRIDLTVDLYSRRSLDLIDVIKTSGIGGQIFKSANYADLKSKGIEVMLGGSPVKTRNFTWYSKVTIAYADTKVTNVDNSPTIFDMVKAEGANFQGYQARSLFSIDFKALDHRSGVPLFTNEKGESSTNVYLQDLVTSHLVHEGPVDPPLTGGFNNTFTYKSFTLNTLITFQAGNKIRMYTVFKNKYTDFDALPKEFYDRWMQSGEEQSTSVPSIADQLKLNDLSGEYPYNVYNYSTQRVAKGDFARLKSVSLAYQLPQTLLKRAGIVNASVQVTAINPLLIYSDSKLHGQDPEFFNAGGVAQPLQKQYVMSLKVTL